MGAVRIVIYDQNPSFASSARDGIQRRRFGAAAGRNLLRIISSRFVKASGLPGSRHALSQVINHAPNNPTSMPTSGLNTANQNGINSCNEIASSSTSQFEQSLS